MLVRFVFPLLFSPPADFNVFLHPLMAVLCALGIRCTPPTTRTTTTTTATCSLLFAMYATLDAFDWLLRKPLPSKDPSEVGAGVWSWFYVCTLHVLVIIHHHALMLFLSFISEHA